MKKLCIYLLIIAVLGMVFNGLMHVRQDTVSNTRKDVTIMIESIGLMVAYADTLEGPNLPPPPPPPLD